MASVSRSISQTAICAASTASCMRAARSEEHTSELQSRQYLVCRLLLEKKQSRLRGIAPQTMHRAAQTEPPVRGGYLRVGRDAVDRAAARAPRPAVSRRVDTRDRTPPR